MLLNKNVLVIQTSNYDEANIEIPTSHFAIKIRGFEDPKCDTTLRNGYGFSDNILPV